MKPLNIALHVNHFARLFLFVYALQHGHVLTYFLMHFFLRVACILFASVCMYLEEWKSYTRCVESNNAKQFYFYSQNSSYKKLNAKK